MPVIKVKNAHFAGTSQLLGRINSLDLDIPLAFHVNTVISRVNECIKIVEELRKKIVDAHTEKNEKGEPIFVDSSKQYIKLTEEGGEKMGELMDLESTVEIEQFTMDQLGRAGIKIKPAEVESVRWMIKQ